MALLVYNNLPAYLSTNRILDIMIIRSFDYHGPWQHKLGHISPLHKRKDDGYEELNVVSLEIN